MVAQTDSELEMATPGDATESPPATTEGASRPSSVIGSPDATERVQSPTADGMGEMKGENEEVQEAEPLIEMPVTPPLADETPPDEMNEEEKPMDQEEEEEAATSEEPQDEVDEPEQTSEAVTEIAADAPPSVDEKVEEMEEKPEEIAEDEEKPETEVAKPCKAGQALHCVKESAHNAVEAIGSKMTTFFGNNMRKVKSLLHINEAAAEPGKEEEAKNLSNSTGNLNNITNSIKSKACTIL